VDLKQIRENKLPFPRKYKNQLETTLNNIDKPDYIWLTYSVCGCSQDACGWVGWAIEAVYKKSDKKYATGTGDKVLPADDRMYCPSCNKPLFRTDASIRLEPSIDQTPVGGIPGKDYAVVPMEYED
jgi:hypothetical protein